MARADQSNAGGSSDRYFNPNPNVIPNNVAAYFDSPIALSIVGLFVLLVITRAASSRKVSPSHLDSKDGANTVPAVPYWLPVLGHIFNMAYDADGFVKGLRKRFTNGIFALNFGGTTHNIMYTPGLATALLNQKQSVANSEEVAHTLMERVFGFPKDEHGKYEAALPELMACYHKHLVSEPSLGEMVVQTAQRAKASIKDLVTGNSSIVDQMQWERTSNVNVTTDKKGEPIVEASLLPLIRDYAAYTANPSIMGSEFLANFPDFFDDVWSLDRGFLLLAAGLPRWLPIPSLTRAHIAKRRLIDEISIFHEALEKEANGEDPGPKWTALDDVGSLVQARIPVYRKHGFSIRARAAAEHALMWAANANSDTLIFWMINRIYADRVLLEMLREEMEPYVQAVQPSSDFLIAEPPGLEKFDVEGLCANCPLLKSCYIECLRLDTASWSLKVVKQDFVLQSRDKDAQGWLLRKGEYAHAAHDLHNTDPNYFDNPTVWKADRHVKYGGDGKRGTADMGSIRPYGEHPIILT
ncbi:hypothetical protein LTR36_005932 [Oleoguttula mirabilis]|uniref:Cytochrome P450 n=1 Tax=Oleoguttula mirabilis TaxID=1507867 RepID=A0AAV9JF89_9PEZI|nr:hypothetical protein LTR36_005932 [Oleoguttula mirabilis]